MMGHNSKSGASTRWDRGRSGIGMEEKVVELIS
jgi:hypothetical protein